MRRFKAASVGLCVALFVAACGDLTRGVGPGARHGLPPATPRASAVAPPPGTCTTLAVLDSLTNVVFGAGSPDANSVLGKLGNLQHQIDIGAIDTAQAKAFNIVSFVIAKFRTGGLPGTNAQVVTLVNDVFCYAGLAISITDAANAFIVYPTDTTSTLVGSDGSVGTVIPNGGVSEPTVITFVALTDTFTVPGSGPLNTKLDQYRGFVGLRHASANNTPFTQPVSVGVCPAAGIPADVRARLRLGHNASAGFEITPPADASYLQCPTTTAQLGTPRSLWRSLASVILPRVLYARQIDAFSGGVGGTAGEYSDFAPVDPTLSISGGVGGTAGEYIRSTARLMSHLTGACATVPPEAPIGTPLDPSCLPLITVTTALGTPFVGVPVSWQVTAGGGVIAPNTLAGCGAFGSTASTTTGPHGKTGVCWTMGVAGTNTVVATPGVGGDAPLGVTFIPATTTFNATANPPVGITFDVQPPATVTAGSPFTVAAKVVDHNGVQVLGSSDAVTLTLNQFTFAGGLNTATVNAVNGYASFTGLQINKAATGYQLTANGAFVTSPNVPAVSNTFTVVPAGPYAMSIVQGDGQTAPFGTVLPINPTVLVSDQFANPVPSVGVSWVAGLSSTGSVSPTATTTDASGQTFASWTVGDGSNQLTASVTSAPSIFALFQATGTSTLSILDNCLPGGSGDPMNYPGKTYAFYLPNPGKNHAYREIQLYISSSGKANAPTPYTVQLTTQLGTFDPAVSVPIATTTIVSLRGNNSENKLTTFALSQPIVGVGGGPLVMVRLSVLTNPDNSTLNFNTGPCSPGSNCKVPQACNATEVNSYTPYPTGTLYRKSVGIVVKGY